MGRIKGANGELMKYSMQPMGGKGHLTLYRYDQLAVGGADNAHLEFWIEIEELRKQLADAQATIAALQAQLKDMVLRNKILRDRLDLPPERCAFHDEVVSLQARVEAHERAYQEGHPTPCTLGSYCPYCEIERRVAHLTQRTAECDALKLVNDTHMKTVMKLSHVVEQRTAELEAARTALNALRDGYDDLESRHSDAQAELGRVRGELVEATHNANVYQSLYSTGCMDRALLENERGDLRTLVVALPKVEGEIRVNKVPCGFPRDKLVEFVWCVEADLDNGESWGLGTFDTPEEAESYAAILKHRQGMEG